MLIAGFEQTGSIVGKMLIANYLSITQLVQVEIRPFLMPKIIRISNPKTSLPRPSKFGHVLMQGM
jgi:hypothetical protein